MSGTAVILAAGRGLRLRPHTDMLPKALLTVAGRPVIEHIFDALRSAGARRFVLATGYREDAFSALQVPAGCSLQYVANKRWSDTNSMYSLLLCAAELRNGGYIVEGDCCFDASLFANISKQAQTSLWFARPFSAGDDGCCLRADSAGIIRSLSIEKRGALPRDGWKSCGVLRVSPEVGSRLGSWLEAARLAGRERDYYDLVLGEHLQQARIAIADIAGAPWHEVDNEDDLLRACEIFGGPRA
jgi:choline kinase